MTNLVRDHKKPKPLFLAKNKLQGMIHNKELKPGDRLPPQRDLALKFQVSRPTVRGAIQLLASIGVLLKIRGYKDRYQTSSGI